MLVGVLLKFVLRKRLKLVFTSAAQRRRGEYSRWLIRRMDAVIAASGKAKSYLGVPATVVLHGIDSDVFAPPTDRAALRTELGLDPDALIVGCFGRIREQKGTDIFVDAMIELLPRHPSAQGIIMGGVTREQQAFVDGLKAKIEAAGLGDRLRILPEDKGFTIAPWFQASDIYVAPQRWEGFGLTPLEAMSCGVAVVATRVGAFEDLVVPDETGFLVPPEDLDQLIAATDNTFDGQEEARADFEIDDFASSDDFEAEGLANDDEEGWDDDFLDDLTPEELAAWNEVDEADNDVGSDSGFDDFDDSAFSQPDEAPMDYGSTSGHSTPTKRLGNQGGYQLKPLLVRKLIPGQTIAFPAGSVPVAVTPGFQLAVPQGFQAYQAPDGSFFLVRKR